MYLDDISHMRIKESIFALYTYLCSINYTNIKSTKFIYIFQMYSRGV